MVYLIAVLDQSDIEGIGRQMPSGTGVDASLVGDGSTATRKRKKRGKYKKIKNNNDNNNTNIASVIETIGNSESRLNALEILIKYGTAEEKRQALAKVRTLAYQKTNTTCTASEAASNAAPEAEEDAEAAAEEESCAGSEDSDGSL